MFRITWFFLQFQINLISNVKKEAIVGDLALKKINFEFYNVYWCLTLVSSERERERERERENIKKQTLTRIHE